MIPSHVELTPVIVHPAAVAEHSRRIAIQHERPADCRLSGVEIVPEIRNRMPGEMQRGRVIGGVRNCQTPEGGTLFVFSL